MAESQPCGFFDKIPLRDGDLSHQTKNQPSRQHLTLEKSSSIQGSFVSSKIADAFDQVGFLGVKGCFSSPQQQPLTNYYKLPFLINFYQSSAKLRTNSNQVYVYLKRAWYLSFDRPIFIEQVNRIPDLQESPIRKYKTQLDQIYQV